MSYIKGISHIDPVDNYLTTAIMTKTSYGEKAVSDRNAAYNLRPTPNALRQNFRV
jgi:hypothetical protein